MNNWTFERIELPELGVMRYNLMGEQDQDKSMVRTRALCERLKTEDWKGLLFDYTNCQICHTLPEFSSLLEFFVENMPKTIKVAYIFDQGTFIPASQACRALQQAGINAQAFTDDDEAMAFLTLKNWCRPLHA